MFVSLCTTAQQNVFSSNPYSTQLNGSLSADFKKLRVEEILYIWFLLNKGPTMEMKHRQKIFMKEVTNCETSKRIWKLSLWKKLMKRKFFCKIAVILYTSISNWLAFNYNRFIFYTIFVSLISWQRNLLSLSAVNSPNHFVF